MAYCLDCFGEDFHIIHETCEAICKHCRKRYKELDLMRGQTVNGTYQSRQRKKAQENAERLVKQWIGEWSAETSR